MKRMASGFLTLALVFGGIGQAKADLAASLWAGQANNQSASDTPTGPVAATFTAHSFNYASSSDLTISGFLQNGGGPNTETSTYHQLTAGGALGSTVNHTFIQFTGLVFLNTGMTTFSSTHDDGLVVIVDGTKVINSPLPTPAINSNGTISESTAGFHSITIDYVETNGPPARLLLSINNGAFTVVPEPATLTMAVAGLVAFGSYKLRRRMQVVA